MTFADTDLNEHIKMKPWIAMVITIGNLFNIGITAYSLPPGTYLHAIGILPWLYLLVRFNSITKSEPDYLRFTELWTITFIMVDFAWGIYYFYQAAARKSEHFLVLAVTDWLADLSAVTNPFTFSGRHPAGLSGRPAG